MDLAPGKLVVLHNQVNELLPKPSQVWRRMVLHALVELGQLTAMECQYENCEEDGKGFVAGSHKARSLSIDHRIAICNGGSELPSNLKVMHWRCNIVKGLADARELTRASRSANMSKRWKDPAFRAVMAAHSRDPLVRQRKSEAMKNYWAERRAG